MYSFLASTRFFKLVFANTFVFRERPVAAGWSISADIPEA